MTTPRSISAAAFKTHCLRLLDEVQRTRKPLIVTKRGRPVARLVPTEEPIPELFGAMRGTVKIVGDIVGPTGVKWNAQR